MNTDEMLVCFTGKSGKEWRQPLTAMFEYGFMNITKGGMGLIIGAAYLPIDPTIQDDLAELRHTGISAWLCDKTNDTRYPGTIIAGNPPGQAFGGTACVFVHVTGKDLAKSPQPHFTNAKDSRREEVV